MRDILVTALVFGSIPFILLRPWIGVLVWSWLAYMNPHRLTWGFAYDFQFAQVIAVVTLVALVWSREKKQVPVNGTTITWLLWICWLNVTTFFALFPNMAGPEWERAMKIQLFALVTILLMRHKDRLIALVWVIVISLGFYGAKGGVFSILTGGQYIVWGPEGSFIAGNNSIGLAMIMTIPLMWFLYQHYERRLIRWGMLGLIGLTTISIFTTHSRGAFLAIGAMAFFLWFKSRQKALLGIGILLLLPLLFFAMPIEFQDRMFSISDYQEDGSAMGRINAWWMAFNLALDRPMLGGGFGAFRTAMFRIYAPDPDDFHDAHSIYFEVLGEHGFMGLALFLMLGCLTFWMGGWIIQRTKGIAELQWAQGLASMLQVSLVGYAVGGAFLGLAYFDLYYHLIAMMVLVHVLVTNHFSNKEHEEPVEEVRPGVPRVRGVGAPKGDRKLIAWLKPDAS